MKTLKLLALAMLLLPMVVQAQTNEYGLWTNLTLEKSIRKWDFSTTAELRTTNYLSDISKWSLDIDASYNLIKSLKIGASYKFIDFHDFRYSDFQPRNRFIVYMQGRKKLDRFTFSLRERMELTTKDESDRIKSSGAINTYAINPDIHWRNKLKVTYDIMNLPLKPSFSVESFYQLNNPDGNNFDELRYTLALDYRLSKHRTLQFYGLMSKELNVVSPTTKYIGGIGYTISF